MATNTMVPYTYSRALAVGSCASANMPQNGIGSSCCLEIKRRFSQFEFSAGLEAASHQSVI